MWYNNVVLFFHQSSLLYGKYNCGVVFLFLFCGLAQNFAVVAYRIFVQVGIQKTKTKQNRTAKGKAFSHKNRFA